MRRGLLPIEKKRGVALMKGGERFYEDGSFTFRMENGQRVDQRNRRHDNYPRLVKETSKRKRPPRLKRKRFELKRR